MRWSWRKRICGSTAFVVEDESFVEADVFSYLRKLRADHRTFDVIIADPPKLAQSQSQIDRAARAYKDLNLVSMQLLKPGGYLITFSCSGCGVERSFSEDRVWGVARRWTRCADRGALVAGWRSSRLVEFPRSGIFERTGVPGVLERTRPFAKRPVTGFLSTELGGVLTAPVNR